MKKDILTTTEFNDIFHLNSSYHPFRMCSKRNGAASVRCHLAMNWPIPVASTGL
jgi:hypothetical protein